MKASKIEVLLFISLSVAITACQKGASGTTATTKPVLTPSKSVVKMGEPLVVTTTGQAPGSSVHWSVSPTASVWTSSNGDSATVLFTSSGNYQVTATYTSTGNSSAYDSSNSGIIVSDSLYTDTTAISCLVIESAPIVTGDQVVLTPISFSDSAGLVFLAHTLDIYSYYPVLTYTGNLSGTDGNYEADFSSVGEYPCNAYNLQSPAINDVFFSGLTNGTHDLIFKLNGTTYQGSMTVSNSSCSFSWNYNSGVTISPLQIPKVQ